MGKFFKTAAELLLEKDNVFTSINIPTVFHKMRDKKTVANTNIYSFKNKKEVKSFLKDLGKMGYGKKL